MNTALRKIRIFICLCLSIGIILSSVIVPSFASSAGASQRTSPILSVNDNIDRKILDSQDNKEDITTDRFIIKYKDNKAKEKVTSLLKSKVSESKKISRNSKLELITTKSKIKKGDLLAELKGKNADVDIEYIQPDYKISLSTNDTYFNDQWGVCDSVYGSVYSEGSGSYDIGAVGAWEVSTGAGAVVAVIDTGIDVGHEDLSPNIWSNPGEIPGNGIDDDNNGYIDDVQGWDFCENDSSVHNPANLNDEQHGTHVAGIIAAVKDNSMGIAGVASNAKIMPLKAFTGGTAYTSEIIAAIEYASQMGVKIVNCSWGNMVDNPALRDTISNSEMLFVCAAGNSGLNIDVTPVYPASYDFPNILTVASINRDGDLSSFSNYGTSSVDVTAPGEGILSTLPGDQYGQMSGTSMAAPFVSGEAALVYSIFENLSTNKVKERIINTSNIIESNTDKIYKGNLIDCLLAVSSNSNISLFSSSPSGISFSRPSTAYKIAGTKVQVNQPRYENGKFGQAIMVEEGTANLLANNSFETDTSGWILSSAASRSNGAAYIGNGSLALTNPTTPQGSNYNINGISPSTKYTISVYVKNINGINARIDITELDSSGNAVVWDANNIFIPSTVNNSWIRYSKTITTDSKTAKFAIRVICGEYGAQTGVCYFDCFQVEQKAYLTSFTDSTRGSETLAIPATAFSKGNWSVELTYIPLNTHPEGQIYLLWGCWIDDNNFYYICTGWGNDIWAEVTSGGVRKYISGPIVTPSSTYTIMLSGNGSVMSLCVNGVKIGSDLTYAEPIGNLPTNMYIGSSRSGGSQANGLIDDFRISNRARTIAEIQTAYSSNQPLPIDDSTTCKISLNGNLDMFSVGNTSTFSRPSTAYKIAGTKVQVNQPRYETGKFGQAIMMEEGTTNLLTNNSFETDTSGWILSSAASRSNGAAYIGNGSLALTNPTTPQGSNYNINGISPSTKYTISVYVKNINGINARIDITELDSSGNAVVWDANNIFIPSTVNNSWIRYSKTITTDSKTAKFAIRVICGEYGAQTGVCYFDCFQVEQKAYLTSFTDSTRGSETLAIPATAFSKGNWSVELTYIPLNTHPEGQIYLLWGCWIDDNNFYYICTGWGNDIWAEVTSGGVRKCISGPIATPGSTYTIMLSGNGSVMRLCVNGVKIGSDLTYTEPVGNLPTNMYIGSSRSGGSQANGLIDEFRISNRARTITEIQVAYSSNQPLPIDDSTTCKMGYDNNLFTIGLQVSYFTGLYGEYYDNINLSNLKFTRMDDKVDFEWGTGSPDPRIQPDTFSVRWTGQIIPYYTEEYTFYIRADDGVRVWINDQLVIDSWVTQANERSANINLVAGREYDIRIEYYENTVGATAVLSWSSASQPKQVVPQDRLFYNHAVPYSHLIIDGLIVRPATYNNVKLAADIINDGTAATDSNTTAIIEFLIGQNGNYSTLEFGVGSYTGIIRPGEFRSIDSEECTISAGAYTIGARFKNDPNNYYRRDNVVFPSGGSGGTPTPTPPPQGAKPDLYYAELDGKQIYLSDIGDSSRGDGNIYAGIVNGNSLVKYSINTKYQNVSTNGYTWTYEGTDPYSGDDSVNLNPVSTLAISSTENSTVASTVYSQVYGDNTPNYTTYSSKVFKININEIKLQIRDKILRQLGITTSDFYESELNLLTEGITAGIDDNLCFGLFQKIGAIHTHYDDFYFNTGKVTIDAMFIIMFTNISNSAAGAALAADAIAIGSLAVCGVCAASGILIPVALGSGAITETAVLGSALMQVVAVAATAAANRSSNILNSDKSKLSNTSPNEYGGSDNAPYIGKPGSAEWNNAVNKVKNTKGDFINVKVVSMEDAQRFLNEIKPGIPELQPNQVKTNYSYEWHLDINSREIDIGNKLMHIKWVDYRLKKLFGSEGHIYFND